MKGSRVPPPCTEATTPTPRTRLQKLKKVLYQIKNRTTREEKKKTKIKSTGRLNGQWTQKELPRIVRKIVDNNPGLTSLEIYGNEIRWSCEMDYFDLFPKKKGNSNPSKREQEKG